ncbi:hypothetical protein JCM3775_004107 [Rhodotorula graminis]
MLSRVCNSCVRSARQLVRPAALPAARPAPRAFSAAAPVFKKASKQVQEEFDDEFVEEEFDDFEEDLASSPAASSPAGQTKDRSTLYAQAVGNVQQALRRAKKHDGRSFLPSTSLVDHLVRAAEPSQLPEVLSLVAKWRAASLPALPDSISALVVKRLVKLDADEGQAAVEVLLNRDQFGLDVPTDLAALYPVFAKISRPQAAAAAAEGAEASDAAAPVAVAASGAYRFLSSSPADVAFALHGLARQNLPASAPNDALVGLSTLAAALRSGERSSARVDELVKRVVAVGEDELVRQARGMSRRWRDIVRMRARVVAEAMREEGHGEVEWFAHLAESLHAVAK